jgi:hypothetical protein
MRTSASSNPASRSLTRAIATILGRQGRSAKRVSRRMPQSPFYGPARPSTEPPTPRPLVAASLARSCPGNPSHLRPHPALAQCQELRCMLATTQETRRKSLNNNTIRQNPQLGTQAAEPVV